MLSELETFLLNLAHVPAVLITVEQARGSVPREVGAWMAVFADATRGEVGTIGGGHLEWKATRQAREALARRAEQPDETLQGWHERVTLGPSLGQCCGGSLVLRFEPVDASHGEELSIRLRPAHTPLALFGGGHVGRAIVQALEPLPFDVTWIDSRDGVFPLSLPPQVSTEHSEPVHAAVRDLPAGACVLIMSFSHAEDLDVVAACLQRQRERNDLAFIGLIGSRTKWATFGHRLMERGFSAEDLGGVTCPIGLPGIVSKVPAVIAASVVAQLLLAVEASAGSSKTP
ncbi:xanthine dehydrogenase accessory protein XdhC [Hydrogenophaga sp.]|uniref:xanthine dehydrogenase accessory protein XdhC n=1 Tax=Hydrogenophaga sp. TaxID=1904254 RepID=UPI0025BFAC76|nr:xanthine dehydrogenase accessory protein XdhC [Hydrogenophaga sp.]MBT9465105.1 xanthine dehydrogenase accessory protein XdhC [Hydrogenophaga sp.]